VSYAIVAGHVAIGGILCDDGMDTGLDNFLVVSESEEYWLSICILDFN